MNLKQFLEREPTPREEQLYEKYKDSKIYILTKNIFGELIIFDNTNKIVT